MIWQNNNRTDKKYPRSGSALLVRVLFTLALIAVIGGMYVSNFAGNAYATESYVFVS
ncbi:secreted protein, partial [Candidatus Magnetobacterium bavaricum]